MSLPQQQPSRSRANSARPVGPVRPIILYSGLQGNEIRESSRFLIGEAK